MKEWMIWIVIALLLGGLSFSILSLTKPHVEKDLMVFAAASLSNAYEELATNFEEQHPGVRVTLNFASSGTLQIQIEQGAMADVFASAGIKQMNALLSKELIDQTSVKIFARNRLVITSTKPDLEIKNPADLLIPKIREICVADPSTVPAGQYAAAALENLNIWDDLYDKMVFARTVRQVLQYVEQGEVDLGFVYLTDAQISDHAQILYILPQDTHPSIQYPIGIVKEGKNLKLAEQFLELVLSRTGQAILKKYGFEPIQ